MISSHFVSKKRESKTENNKNDVEPFRDCELERKNVLECPKNVLECPKNVLECLQKLFKTS